MIDAETLNALVDDELSSEERTRLEAILSEDPQAAREAGSIRTLKAVLKDKVQPVRCEEEWKACVKRLDEIDKARRTDSFVSRYAWAMCCVLFALIVGAGWLNRSTPGYRMDTSDLAGMSASLSPASISSGPESWLGKMFGKSPQIPPDRLRVLGGQQGVYQGQPIAKLNMADGYGRIDLLVLPATRPVLLEAAQPMDEKFLSGRIGRHNYVAWTDDGMFMLLSGERDPSELRDVARNLDVARR